MSFPSANENPLRDDLEHVLAHTRELWQDFRDGRVFMTGGSGFFGCWLLESFIYANERLSLDARATVLTRDPQKFRNRMPHLARGAGIDLLQGDVSSFVFPAGEFSHVLHAAVEYTHPLGLFSSIVDGTRRTLEFACAAHAERYLLTSSGAVYGSQPPEIQNLPETYNGAPDPLTKASAYSEGKRAAEFLCAAFHESEGVHPTISRGFAFIGPYLSLTGSGAAGNFIRDILAGRAITIQGDGTPYRSYLYAADLTIWLWKILCRAEACRAYNVGSAVPTTIKSLADTMVSVAAPETSVHVLGKAIPGQPAQRYVPNVDRAREELGLEAWIDLPEAVRRTIAWSRLQSSLRT